MSKSINTDCYPDADSTPADFGVPDRQCVSQEKIEELKNDWEQGINNELIWAETQNEI